MEAFNSTMDCYGDAKDKQQSFDFHPPLPYAQLDAAQHVDPEI
jgi:hypothetical protein